MPQAKRKAVFTADPDQLARIQIVVTEGRYRSSSEFFREAIDEKLERLRRERLAEQVTRYCVRGYGEEDAELAGVQASETDG
jgi:Arc/MetJ-type ribon-helix-helix transcriptional regulator